MSQLFTLCFVLKDNQVLLGMKKRSFGKGKWNGFGGKVSEGESIEDATRRELFEEAGIEVKELQGGTVMKFKNFGVEKIAEVHVFKTNVFSGEPKETDEMKPQWFDIDALPFDMMWKDDAYWLPKFLAGKRLEGMFEYGEHDQILKHEVKELE
jgi:8-oxo-dGTP diphosphatase/2-hydroxy-dATP diphosphatase